MATFTIVSEGTPIIPYNLNVVINVNHSAFENSQWVTATPYPSQAFSDAVDTHTSNWENAIKTNSDFTTQDTNRNGTWQVEVVGPFPEDESRILYNLVTSCTVENAVAEVSTSTQSDKTGAELTADLQLAADAKEVEFFGNRPAWSPIPSININ